MAMKRRDRMEGGSKPGARERRGEREKRTDEGWRDRWRRGETKKGNKERWVRGASCPA